MSFEITDHVSGLSDEQVAQAAAEAEACPGADDGSELVGTAAKEWRLEDWVHSEPLTLRGLRGRVVLQTDGQIKTGRILDYLGKPNRKMCSLYLGIMDRMGIKLNSFGDAESRLAGL